jgi:hypothetical protein
MPDVMLPHQRVSNIHALVVADGMRHGRHETLDDEFIMPADRAKTLLCSQPLAAAAWRNLWRGAMRSKQVGQ